MYVYILIKKIECTEERKDKGRTSNTSAEQGPERSPNQTFLALFAALPMVGVGRV